MAYGEKETERVSVSVIVPCRNEEEALPIYYRKMRNVMEEMSSDAEFELLFVDDGSEDGTLAIMQSLCEKDRRCGYLSFSRNFGKEAAMYAGLQHVKGDYAAIMDADLQDPPDLLQKMLCILRTEEYDSVATRRSDRTGEPKLRSFLANQFYRFINRISDTEIVAGARDYRLMSRRMVNAVLRLSECNRFSKGIFSWVGFRTKWLDYENVERLVGETKWSVGKLFRYALDGITGFSVAPLWLADVFGIGFCAAACLLALFLVAQALFWHKAAGSLFLACIILFVSGIQLLCTGILGQYLSGIYVEAKHRPVYIIKESSENMSKEDI